MNTQQIWQAVLGDLELSLSKANFTTWFKGTFILEIGDIKVIIGVPNAFTKSWLEKKYNSELLRALRNITEFNLKEIEYKVSSLKNFKQNDVAEKRTALDETVPFSRGDQKEAKIPPLTLAPGPEAAPFAISKLSFNHLPPSKPFI